MSDPATGTAIYAIRYASRPTTRGDMFFDHDPDCGGTEPIDYFVWTIVTPDGIVQFDAGYTKATSDAKGPGREYFADPADTLRRLDIDPAAVGHLAISHLHYDHTGHLAAFPNATIVIQQREVGFWTGPYAGRGPYPALCLGDDLAYLVRANLEGKVRVVDGDVEIVPGVTAHLLGGHTEGLQVLRVRTDKGHVVLAADGSHFYANIGEDRPFSIVTHLPSMYGAFDRMRELAGAEDLIVPGHDPRVRDRFAEVPGLEGLAYRIA